MLWLLLSTCFLTVKFSQLHVLINEVNFAPDDWNEFIELKLFSGNERNISEDYRLVMIDTCQGKQFFVT